jgi:hypothetical protein
MYAIGLVLPTRLGGAAINERLAPFIRRIHLLENHAALLENSLPHSFALVRGEMNMLWNDLEDL